MIDLSATVDTSKFDAAFSEYLKDTSKSLDEAVNTKALFITINSINATPSATNEEIKNELTANADIANAPLGALLTNIQRKLKGKRGVNGDKMVQALAAFIRFRQATKGFLKRGFLPAKRILSAYVDSVKGGPRIKGTVRQKGADMGYAIPAKGSSWVPEAVIANTVQGSNHGNKEQAHEFIQRAVQTGINQEADNTEKHILEKRLKETAAKFNG